MIRIALLTVVAMLAFAANSILARLALSAGDADALGYTGLRIVSGAIVLALILLARNGGLVRSTGGSWTSAGALLLYALAFSIAYLMLGAGTGALILFASVQIGILSWAIVKGDRPGPVEWLGMAIAFAALIYLVSPGLVAPSPLGAALMIVSGLSWAGYTLLGRGSRSPLADTAGNFLRAAPAGVLLMVLGAVAFHLPSLRTAAYATASGAIASGMGYAVWYAVLPSLTRTRAAIVQLTVPAIAAVAGALIIGEPLTIRLAIALVGILGGVALALIAAEWRKSRPA